MGVLMDELSFSRDESSTNADVETYRAVLPSLATTGGMLIAISSPYRRRGMLQKHRVHFEKDSDNVLVLQGATELFNPTISKDVTTRPQRKTRGCAGLSGLVSFAAISLALLRRSPCAPAWTRASMSSYALLDDGRLIGQLLGLERRAGRSGRDIVDHAPGGFDDLANAALGALDLAATGAGSIALIREEREQQYRQQFPNVDLRSGADPLASF
jgi:hypothetical protein